MAACGKLMSDDYVRYITHLRSGDEWDVVVKEWIAEADLFQLFWSSNSASSPWVRGEWEYARSLNREGFIRCINLENPPPPVPRELVELHFPYFPFRGGQTFQALPNHRSSVDSKDRLGAQKSLYATAMKTAASSNW